MLIVYIKQHRVTNSVPSVAKVDYANKTDEIFCAWGMGEA